MKWFPELHQFTFNRNDSWINSVWLLFCGIPLLIWTFVWSFVVTPIFWMMFGILLGLFGYFVNLVVGMWLTVKLGGRLLWYAPFGFASTRNITKEELFRQAVEKAKAKIEAAEKK